ncbi:MAG TPA: HipA family kinase [Candidatus Limnocylindrales bacterium]
MVRTVAATRYVTPLREGGSLPALVEADDDGLYVLKFRAAAQGPRALVAELVVGEIGRLLGLPIPEIVFIELDPALANAEPDGEIQPLIASSGGLNIGLDFLPGSLPFSPAVGPIPSPELAADIVWFDALTTNPDRTLQNPNMLVWHRAPWLIDHGAALYIHPTWKDPAAHARRPFPRIRDHVLRPFAGSLVEADARLAPRLDREALAAVVELIPDSWLPLDSPAGSARDQRRAYLDYLERRLRTPRPFLIEATDAVA